jgi:hypothetical protein
VYAVTRGSTTHTEQSGRSWLRAAGALFRHVTRTMPWTTQIAGCLTGTAVLWLLRYVSDTNHSAVDQNTMRFTILPAIAAVAFVPHIPFRPLVDTTPVPAWIASAGQIVLAIPILALTCWVQLLLISPRTPPGVIAPSPAIYPILAQITGWCALTVTVAACADRSRYADLGGAVAAPASLALIGLATYGPKINHVLATPPAGRHVATAAWYGIAVAALALTYLAMGDRWHRYTRARSRQFSPRPTRTRPAQPS